MDVAGDGDYVGIVHQETDDPGHGEVGLLAYDVYALSAEPACEQAYPGVFDRAEVVARYYCSAAHRLCFFDADDLRVTAEHVCQHVCDPARGAGPHSERRRAAFLQIFVYDRIAFFCREHGVMRFDLGEEVAALRRALYVFYDLIAVASDYHRRIFTPFSCSFLNVTSDSAIMAPRFMRSSRHFASDSFCASEYPCLKSSISGR